jgi:hypothetical protein
MGLSFFLPPLNSFPAKLFAGGVNIRRTSHMPVCHVKAMLRLFPASVEPSPRARRCVCVHACLFWGAGLDEGLLSSEKGKELGCGGTLVLGVVLVHGRVGGKAKLKHGTPAVLPTPVTSFAFRCCSVRSGRYDWAPVKHFFLSRRALAS